MTTSKPNAGSRRVFTLANTPLRNAVDDGACVRKLDALPDPSVLGAENHRLIPTPKLMLATRRAAGFDSGIGNQRTILGDAGVLLVADGVLVERAGR